jgi:hypothetical protein
MDSESSTAGKPSRGLVTWLIWLLVLVIFIGYPLSVGPIAALYSGKAPSWVLPFYAPLDYAVEHIPGLGAFYEWYLPLWGVR